jgi:hypothetical protein
LSQNLTANALLQTYVRGGIIFYTNKLWKELPMESTLYVNIPVQMISCTDTDGKITPLRFRFRERDGELVAAESLDSLKNAFFSEARRTCGDEFLANRRTFLLWNLEVAFVQGEQRILKLYSEYAPYRRPVAGNRAVSAGFQGGQPI